MTAASVYSRALLKAAELIGGRDALAKVLSVARSDIDGWIADEAKPPREVFLRVVDIILDETSAAGAGDTSEPLPDREAAGPTRYVD